jgi:hypothetical protein
VLHSSSSLRWICAVKIAGWEEPETAYEPASLDSWQLRPVSGIDANQSIVMFAFCCPTTQFWNEFFWDLPLRWRFQTCVHSTVWLTIQIMAYGFSTVLNFHFRTSLVGVVWHFFLPWNLESAWVPSLQPTCICSLAEGKLASSQPSYLNGDGSPAAMPTLKKYWWWIHYDSPVSSSFKDQVSFHKFRWV